MKLSSENQSINQLRVYSKLNFQENLNSNSDFQSYFFLKIFSFYNGERSDIWNVLTNSMNTYGYK